MTELIMTFALAVAVALGAVWFNNYRCEAQWQQFHGRFSIGSGCMINVPGKGWMPAQNYRVL